MPKGLGWNPSTRMFEIVNNQKTMAKRKTPKPQHLFVKMHSKESPQMISCVLKNSTLEKAKELAREIYRLNPTAYIVTICDDDTKELFCKNLLL